MAVSFSMREEKLPIGFAVHNKGRYTDSWSYNIILERLIDYNHGKTPEVQVEGIERNLETIIQEFKTMKDDLSFLLRGKGVEKEPLPLSEVKEVVVQYSIKSKEIIPLQINVTQVIEEAHRKEEDEKRHRELKRERYNQEVEKVQALENEANDYDMACKIRAYISAVEDKASLDGSKPKWIEWAKAKADWYDPTVAAFNHDFGKRNHTLDEEKKRPSKKQDIVSGKGINAV